MSGALKSLTLRLLRRTLRLLVGEYSAYFIYQSPELNEPVVTPYSVRAIDAAELEASADEAVRRESSYLGPESLGFACLEGDSIVGLCFYWHGARYRQRNFWPLAADQAKLVQIVTVSRAQGRGVATALIRGSMACVREANFRCAFARVWHSNVASYKAFERAGWRRIAFVAELHPFGRAKPWRVTHNFRAPE